MQNRRRRAMVLSLAIVILVILLVLATAVTTMGTGNLNFSLGQLSSERASEVAEAGLSYAYSDLGMGQLNDSSNHLQTHKVYVLGQTPTQDQASVDIYDNRSGTNSQPSGCPVSIPHGYIYLVSTGELMNGSSVTKERKVGALVCLSNGGAMSFGVNCHSLVIDQGILAAYDLLNSAEVSGYTLIASNTTVAGGLRFPTGSQSVEIRGNILLPSGVSAATVASGNYNFASGGAVQNLASPLDFPKIDVPVLAAAPAPTIFGLMSGYYPSLNVDTPLTLQGRYVIDNLTIASGGSLRVETGNTVSVYVQNLSLTTVDPPFYHTGSSNHFKFFYQGNISQTMHLDSNSHVSYISPKAGLTIYPADMTLGAFAAHDLVIHMANPTDKLYYDPTAAQPVVPNQTSVSSSAGSVGLISGQSSSSGSSSTVSPDSIIPGYQAVTVMGRQRF